jgi:YgiT-type zinc finger domain-containing protein
MTDESAVPPGHDIAARVFDEMATWRQGHPHASFAEIEAAVEERLDRLRADLIQQELQLKALADAAAPSDRPLCPSCGKPLESRGTRERSVTVRGNRPVRLRRRYLVCPACGTGVFPPGPGAPPQPQ